MVKVLLENVAKKFGERSVVNDINLEIHDKEFFVLLGPSGCGKTTTLNIIAGLENVTSGNIRFDDKVVNELPPEERNVAMVFQSFALYLHKDAYDNIAFPLTLRKLSRDEIDKRVKETAAKLRITDLLGRKPHQMSGGERQRVALARAIVRNPSVFLLDEPLSNIDAKLRLEMRAELIRLHKDLQTTMIYVTHDQVEALTMADRIAVMDKGKVLQVGEPMEIFEKPVSKFVGGFIGSPPMNFMECSLSKKDSLTLLQMNAFSIEISNEVGTLIQQKATSPELIVGVRPQDISISRQKTSNRQIESEIYAVEPLGTETLVDLSVGGSIIRGVTPGAFKAQLGEKIWFSVNEKAMHVFDKRTEQAVL